jgi:pteridine reductase
MNQTTSPATCTPCALITGGSQRIGKAVCEALHRQGYNIVIHYRNSKEQAQALAESLNLQRSQSAFTYQANLNNINEVNALSQFAIEQSVSLLINNASSFYPTEIGSATVENWDDLFNSNVKAAFFLAQNLTDCISQNQGSIINIVDIHSEKPMKNHPIYSMAKAALNMMTKALAKDLGEKLRVNGVSPGAILWPEHELDDEQKQQDILSRIPLNKIGQAEDIAQAVVFLAQQSYITGQIINVDGGRSLNM